VNSESAGYRREVQDVVNDNREEVIVIDDDIHIRCAINLVLSTSGFATRIFSSAQEFLECGQPVPAVGCLVLDVGMPGINGIELQAQLRQREVDLPIVFITGHGTIPITVQAMKQGALDFLEKPVESEVLIDAIRKALELSRRRFAERQKRMDLGRRFASLSGREREVFRLVVMGFMNKQIAVELGVVEQTVKVHRSRVMEKLQAGSLVELICMAEMLSYPTCSAAIMASLK
jgi:FixJ family two-component response regulator